MNREDVRIGFIVFENQNKDLMKINKNKVLYKWTIFNTKIFNIL